MLFWIVYPRLILSYNRKFTYYCVIFGIFEGFSDALITLFIWLLFEIFELFYWQTMLIVLFVLNILKIPFNK